MSHLLSKPLLDLALASHHDWPLPLAEPGFVRALNDGQSNQSYLYQYGDHPLVVRLNHQNAFLCNSPALIEFTAQKMAADVGLAAKPVYLDPQHRWLISVYEEGFHPQTPSLMQLQIIADSLSRLHQLPMLDFAINLLKVITHFLEKTNKLRPHFIGNILNMQHDLAPFLQKNSANCRLCFCHNDLNPANIVITAKGSLTILDWEYAGNNHPYFDLAAIIDGYALTTEQSAEFLRMYQGSVSQKNWQQFIEYQLLYCYCALLWYAAHPDLENDESLQISYFRLLEKLPGLIEQANAEQRHDEFED